MSDEKPTTSEVTCNACGRINPAGMRFCGFCGNPLQRPADKPVSSSPVAAAVPETPAAPAPRTEAKPPVAPPPSASSGRTAPGRPPAPPSAAPGGVRPLSGDRETERLISQATAYRVKGQITDARLTLQKVLEQSDGMPPQTLAPLYEQVGDLLLTEEMYDDSLAAFEKARALDPKRVSADKKYAEAALQKAQASGKLSINAALLRGDSVADLIASGELGGNRGKRNAGVAMLLSMIVPGFGQFYNGQIVKAFILVGLFAISLLVLSLSPEKDSLFRDIAVIFAMQGGKASFAISPLTTFFALLCLGSWLYAIVDAPFNANKSGAIDSGAAKVDKSGWEV